MKFGLLVAVIVLTNIAFAFVYINRDSDRLLNAIIPIAVASLAAIFLAGFISGSLDNRDEAFQASFQIRYKENLPVDLPWITMGRRFPLVLFETRELFKQNPKFFEDSETEATLTLYNHLLQKVIVDWIGTHYPGGWQMEFNKFSQSSSPVEVYQPTEGASGLPGRVYQASEIETRLKGNYFAHVHDGIPSRFVLPPGTELMVEAPEQLEGHMQGGRILLKNPYCTITIRTQSFSYMRGIGLYRQLSGFSEEQNREFGHVDYIVRTSVRYTSVLSGSPKTAMIRKWANQIVDGLKDQFDEELVWSRTKEDYLFLKQTEALGPLREWRHIP